MACMFNKSFEVTSNNHTGESLAFVVAEIAFKVAVMTSSVAKSTVPVVVVTSAVTKITFCSG